MIDLAVVVGSVRRNRAADLVAPWVTDRAGCHGAFRVQVLDLRDWELPHFDESPDSVGDLEDPTYSDPRVRDWNRAVGVADAYVVVTPEYNHSLPGVLKNALDSVYLSHAMRNKPLAAVGYSTGVAAGARAVEHLAQVAIELEAAPIRQSVLIPYAHRAFDASGDPVDSLVDAALEVCLDDLAWWGSALKDARSRGELRPGRLRLRRRRPAEPPPITPVSAPR